MSFVRLNCVVAARNGSSHATVKFLIGNGPLDFAAKSGKHPGPSGEASIENEVSMPPTSPVRRWTSTDVIALLAFLVLCFAVAAVGSWVTATSVNTWFPTLNKPSFNPPGWVFGPVWTVLYALMAVAAWRVWRRAGFDAGRAALSVFGLQLALNLSWSLIFFGLRSIDMAVVCIVALWLAIAVTIALFRRIDGSAGWLLVPYLAWVSFAAVLNMAIWKLNWGGEVIK
jgi:translocator protein